MKLRPLIVFFLRGRPQVFYNEFINSITGCLSNLFFSIIIPTYNSAALIVRCIESVQLQTCADWEILVIDGESIDNTVQLVEAMARADQRIRCWSEKDKGIYDAMNKGIGRSQGEWLYFLGSDDRLYDSVVLEKIKAVTEQQPAVSVLYGDVYSTRFNGRYAGVFTIEKLYEQNISHQAVFLHRTVFDLIGHFNLQFKGWADYDHNVRWFVNAGIQHAYIDLVVADYADGGFSSAGIDEEMAGKKAKLFLSYGARSFDFKFRARLLVTVALQKKKQKQWLSFVLYKLQYYFFAAVAKAS